MNCRNCGNALLQDNSVCPNCGFNNALEQNNVDDQKSPELLDDGFVELDDEEKVEITENMAPPTLDVESENLSAGAGELSNTSVVSTYSPEEIALEEEKAKKEKENVDIAIPSVQTPVSDVSIPNDGSAPEVSQVESTVGTLESTPEKLATIDNPKKLKFKIKIPKGSKNVPKVLLLVVAVIFLVIGILIGNMFFSKNYCVTTSKPSVVSSNTKFVSDGKNNVTNVGAITYTIPEDYMYDKRDNGILIYEKNDTFRIYIQGVSGSYETISGAKNSVRETLRNNNYTINGVKELKSFDVEFIVFEATTNLVNRMLAFADAGEGYVYYIEMVNINNTFDYDVLEVVADIIKNAKFESVSSEMEKISISNISELAIKAAQEYANLMANN